MLDVANQLTLSYGCIDLRLSKLEEKLEAGHLVIFLELKEYE